MSSFKQELAQFHSSRSTEEHRAAAPTSVAVAILTISDTRAREDDRSGEAIKTNLTWRGHTIADYAIVKDDAGEIVSTIRDWLKRDDIDAVITNGGTGIAGRDTTYEAISGLLERRIDGFGELFRMLSWQEIGAAAMLSRAVAGVASGKAIFCTPGSSNAVKLAMEKLIGPELGHVVHEIRK
jgi:molybdenum cofactor biosynthesis protein B